MIFILILTVTSLFLISTSFISITIRHLIMFLVLLMMQMMMIGAFTITLAAIGVFAQIHMVAAICIPVVLDMVFKLWFSIKIWNTDKQLKNTQ